VVGIYASILHDRYLDILEGECVIVCNTIKYAVGTMTGYNYLIQGMRLHYEAIEGFILLLPLKYIKK
jgi:hypothetical protein